MGTNYYAHKPGKAWSDASVSLHVGKSSAGWDFVWHGHAELGLVAREAWEKYLDDATIVNEYGVEYTIGELICTVVDNRPNMIVSHASFWLRHERPDWENGHLKDVWVDNKGNPFVGVDFS